MAITNESVAKELGAILGEEGVLSGDAAERAYDCDAYTVDRSYPTAVVLPKSTQQVAEVVKWCVRNDVPFTARGAGTGLSGGVLPALGGVVISTKKMTEILAIEVENRRLLAQAGMVNKKISDAVSRFGLHFAPDPSSQTVSTVGGNIAENSGGPHTLKYGVTTQHVLGIKMVSPEGEILTIGGTPMGAPGLDLLGIVVGGEGTLGVVTEAWVKLTPIPTSVQTVLVAFPEIGAATRTVADIIATGTIPAALEMMDAGIMRAVRAAFDIQFPEGSQALLLVECDGRGDGSEERVSAEMATVRQICERNGALSIQLAKDDAERARLWLVRKKGIGAMGRLAPSIVTHDGVIPRSKLPEMLDYVYEVAGRNNLGVANLFHAGDGNLHPCFYFDDRDPDQVKRVVEAGEELMRRCIELGGSITGEHGIGVEKLDLMPLDVLARRPCVTGDREANLQRRRTLQPLQGSSESKILRGAPEALARCRVVATLRPSSLDELSEAVRSASRLSVWGTRFGDRFSTIEPSEIPSLSIGLSGVVEHDVDDQVVTLWAGTPIAELQECLLAKGQCLPFTGFPTDGHELRNCPGTVGGWLSLNLPHSHEADCGNWRDWTLGMTVVLADGSTAKCGSKAVKNVAGYDVQKLFVGARGCLGIVAQVTFRTFPSKALPAQDLTIVKATTSNSGWVQRTLPTDFEKALEAAGDRLIATNPRSSTLYVRADNESGVTRFGQDWVLGWGQGSANLKFDDPTQISLMTRAKSLFDPTSKLNPGQFSIF